MVAYEFYWQDESGNAQLIGILPERRKTPGRITDESVINWARNVVGESANIRDIYFTEVKVE